jgi:hypothetical protein
MFQGRTKVKEPMTKQIMQERNCDNQGGKWKLIQGKKTTNS